ncbi:putative disease resistance RPP8-like protein 4 [Dichanthelium oligosanthes]|uniref:Putative disease resistance RPP8-like protein 4 n=1 Tax=Dichanthelium oligosanthes TaxID=888268 RepID=A0A1E5WNB1_9POAL|nr:putative disease resistance RPP8-like protein 4 [Dichanthelium oligosanthes]
MADAGVTGVVAKLGELAAAEATALLRVDAEIRALRRKLAYLQALVRGADRQRRGRASELLLLWLRETREVAFEVEDAVDEFHLRVEGFHLRRRRGTWWGWGWHRDAVCLVQGLVTQIFVRHGLSNQISKINERIDELNQNKETYQIESSPSEIWSSSSVEADPEWYEDKYVMGSRQGEFETLKNLVMNKEGDISYRAVISILGERGIGKTTLAKKLYNDPDIMKHFEVHAWVCLPQHIRFRDYVDIIYTQVSSQVPEAPGEGEITDKELKLWQNLQNRTYLVVLDGLISISDWNSLFNVLPNTNGSRILLTTHLNVKEINHIDPQIPPIELTYLDMKHGEQLFCQRVFGAKEPPQIYWSKGYYEKVHNISTGLPLAIAVLAGILRSKVIPMEWDDVFKQLESNGLPKPVRSIWSLALDDLPHYLKSCFLYFASVSENVILYPDRLVRLWIAEGFVVPKKAETLEDVGFDYLKELVSRGLVQVMEKDARGFIKLVSIHNLLHAFVESEAQESCFLEIHHHANVVNPNAVRRLAIQNYVDAYVHIPNVFPKLRSLLCDFAEDQCSSSSFGELQPQSLWGNLAELCSRACSISENVGSNTLHGLHFLQGSRFLRVIDLNGLKMQKLPDEIGSIIHLRYLGIRNSNLEELPSSMYKLDNLQTLDVRRTKVGKSVDEFWEIEALRHVLAEKMLLPNCSVPLNNLMTLNGVVPSDLWDENKCPLNNMIYLRSLSLSGISAPHITTLSAALRKMEFLVYLNLSGEVLPSNMFTASNMRRLQVLILHGKLEGINDLVGDRYVLPNLTILHLCKSELSQQFVYKLALLPCLAEMELSVISYSEEALSFNDGFPSLTKLKLKKVSTLQELVIGKGAMPMLSILAMYDCDNLKTLKALNGLEHLQEVAVYNMPEIVDNIKLEDEKLFNKIKCLTNPRMLTDRGDFPGHFTRMARIPHEQRMAMASESCFSGMEGSGPGVGKAVDDIQIHYGPGA